MKAILPIRDTDSYGSGAYGASRGSRTHEGIDLSCYPGTKILPFSYGKVTKIGHPYSDDPDTPDINEYKHYKYVQITDDDNYECRYFYVFPMVKLWDFVSIQDVIGIAQDLTKIYGVDEKHKKPITNHIHFEVKKDGIKINPHDYFELIK